MFNRKLKKAVFGTTWKGQWTGKTYKVNGVIDDVEDLKDEIKKLKAIVAEVTDYVYSEDKEKK